MLENENGLPIECKDNNLSKCRIENDTLADCTEPRQGNGFVIVGDSLISYSGDDPIVTIPNSVRRIAKKAFFKCTSLKEITLPIGLEEIGPSAFEECSSLTHIEIPYHTTSLGDSAFYDCSSLEWVSIPGKVTVIPEDCFYNCSALNKVILHEGLLRIEDRAFANCDSLAELKIPYGTQYLGVIVECGNLLSRVYIPATVTEIHELAFMIDNLEYYVQSNSYARRFAQQSPYKSTIIDVPASVFNAPDTEPNPYICRDSELVNYLGTSVTTVHIPNGIETIGVNAFSNSEIECVVLPESVTRISKFAFEACEKLKTVIICGKRMTIEDSAFSYCSNLQSLVIFSTEISFSEFIFRRVSVTPLLENRSLCFYCPQGSPVIQYAFTKKKNYAIIDPKYVSDSAENIVASCKNLAKQIVPVNALSIQGDTLIECNWTILNENCSVCVPAFVRHIADKAFKEAGCIAEIILPNGLKTIGKEAFMQCSAKKIVVPASVEQIGEAAFAKSRIQEIVLPPIQELPSYAFEECYSLKHVTLPETLLKIGAYAFSNCLDLTGLSLPKHLVEIGEKAFDQCNNLLYLSIPDSVVEIAEHAFSGCFNCVYLCNPSSKAREYMSKHYLPAYAYSDRIIACLQNREKLKANNKNLSFNYQGSAIVVPANYAIYHKFVQQYTPKAAELYREFIALFDNIVHGDPAGASLQFLDSLEKLAETVDRELQAVGIYLDNARGYLYCINPALTSICTLMTSIIDFLQNEDQNAASEMEAKSDIMFAQAESKVTGVNFGIITSSAAMYAAYALDDYFTRVKQRQKAAQQLRADLDNMEKELISRIEARYNQFWENSIKPAIKTLTEQFMQEMLGMVVFYLERYDLLPENTKDMYDYDKAGKLLTTELLSSHQKGAVLGRALSYCPYNMDVYRHIFDEGIQNDVVYQIAAAVGIEKEVASLYERTKIEKERRRREEEKRKIEEAKRRREQELLEQERKEKAAQERARNEKKAQLENQIQNLSMELASIKGLFTGKKKAGIQQEIERLESELKSL